VWRSTRTHTSRSSSAACIWSTGRTTTSTSRPTAHAGSLRSGSLPTLHGSRRCGARLRWATGTGMRSARTTTVISAAWAASPPGRRETGVSSSTSSTDCSSGGDLRCRSAPGRSSAAAHHASKAISTRSIPFSQSAVSATTPARRRCSANGRRRATGSGAFRCSSCRLWATPFASSRWTTTSWPTRATERLPRSRKRPIARSGMHSARATSDTARRSRSAITSRPGRAGPTTMRSRAFCCGPAGCPRCAAEASKSSRPGSTRSLRSGSPAFAPVGFHASVAALNRS
jgi:hypothetical protein